MCAATPSVSGDFTNRRITAGAKIFRALLAADVDIARKIGSDGKLRLCLLYVDDIDSAERAAEVLRNRDDTRIRKMDIRIEILPFAHWAGDKKGGFAGVYQTQTLSDEELSIIVEYAKEQGIVHFSPFEGDVQRGVQCGLAVEARVRPHINTKALRNADIRLKHFFKRVAKQYEE